MVRRPPPGIPIINDAFHPWLVDKSASDKDIRWAYKKLSKKFHPDKNKDPDAESKFIDIAHGMALNYPRFSSRLSTSFQHMRFFPMPRCALQKSPFISSLISRQKRQIYDRYGEDALKAHEGGHQTTNPFDMFASFFGGGCASNLQYFCKHVLISTRQNGTKA